MTTPLSSFAFDLGAGALLLAAAASDVRRFIIPNQIVLALVVLYVARSIAATVAGEALLPMMLPVLLALAVLTAGAFAFQRGWLGGGDVKLLAAATLWLPAERLLDFLALVALLGGGLASLVLIGTRLVAARNAAARPLSAVRLPYGVAISGAGILVLFDLVNL